MKAASLHSKAAAKRERTKMAPTSQELLRRLQQVYRILFELSAFLGVYIWFEDQKTRSHVSSPLPK